MTKKEAIGVLLQAVDLGRQAGVYSFKDAAAISQAIDVIEEEFKGTDKDAVSEPVPAVGGGCQ